MMNHSYLQALGITHWQQRHTSEQPIVSGTASIASSLNWDALQKKVAQCTACGLHQTRTQTVFGVGDTQAKLMIIGEAPGFHEDQQGEPFVGRGGQLLTAMIKTIGFNRSDVYIANILKCRPPNNRDPQPEEVKLCTSFLDQQIALIQPRLLLAVGRIASHYLLNTKASLESLRSKTHYYGEEKIPLIVSYHPAYLLRNPIDKKKAFQDLQFIKKTLEGVSHGSISITTEQTV
jgi:uracil-DNA glycosylase